MEFNLGFKGLKSMIKHKGQSQLPMLEKFLFYWHNCSDVFELQLHMSTLYGTRWLISSSFWKWRISTFLNQDPSSKVEGWFCILPTSLVLLFHCFVPFLISVPWNILCFVDCTSLHNLVNKANLQHNLFLVYLSVSTCFGWLRAHHHEKQLCLCDTWYLLLCVDGCVECRVDTTQSSIQNNK